MSFHGGDEGEGVVERLVGLVSSTIGKFGYLGVLVAVGFFGLQAYYLAVYAPAQATVTNVFTRCEMDKDAASAIGKPPRWWDCESAQQAARRFPSLDFKVKEVTLVTVRFPRADGGEQEATARSGKLELVDPYAGQSAPIRYRSDNPETVTGVMGTRVGIMVAAIGLAGLMLVLFGRRITANRSEIAERIGQGVRRPAT